MNKSEIEEWLLDDPGDYPWRERYKDMVELLCGKIEMLPEGAIFNVSAKERTKLKRYRNGLIFALYWALKTGAIERKPIDNEFLGLGLEKQYELIRFINEYELDERWKDVD